MSLPPEWEDHLETLGPPRGRYPARSVTTQIVVGALLAGLGLIVLLLLLFEWRLLNGGLFKLYILLALAPPFGLAIIWNALRYRGLYALVYPTGVLRVHGGEVNACRWEEVEWLTIATKEALELETVRDETGELFLAWLPLPNATVMVWKEALYLFRRDGTRLHFNAQLEGFEEFARVVQQEDFRHRWPDVRRRCDQGMPQAFGSILLGPLGLTNLANTGVENTLAWHEIDSVTIQNGALIVTRNNRRWNDVFASIALDQIHDPHLLLAVFEYRQPAEPEDDEPTEESEPSHA